MHNLKALLLATVVALSSSATFAQDNYTNEPVLLTHAAYACENALDLEIVDGEFSFNRLSKFDKFRIETCLEAVAIAHFTDPYQRSPDASDIKDKEAFSAYLSEACPELLGIFVRTNIIIARIESSDDYDGARLCAVLNVKDYLDMQKVILHSDLSIFILQ